MTMPFDSYETTYDVSERCASQEVLIRQPRAALQRELGIGWRGDERVVDRDFLLS